jgi:hypothetical protein
MTVYFYNLVVASSKRDDASNDHVIEARLVEHVFREHAGGRRFLTPLPPHTLVTKGGSETVDISLSVCVGQVQCWICRVVKPTAPLKLRGWFLFFMRGGDASGYLLT